MSDKEYSAITEDAIELYRTGRYVFFVWIVLCIGYVIYLYELSPSLLFMNNIPESKANSVVDVAGTIVVLVGLNGIVVFSALFPVFAMVLSAVLFLRARRVVSSPFVKSVFVFWIVQLLTFYLARNRKWFQYSGDTFVLGDALDSLLVSAAFVVITYMIYRLVVRKLVIDNERPERLRNVLYYASAALSSVLVAVLFVLNLIVKNLMVSNGVLFGIFLLPLFITTNDLQQILLFVVAPDSYQSIIKEIRVHHSNETQAAVQKANESVRLGVEEVTSTDKKVRVKIQILGPSIT
jgi:hypothetical protein